MVLSPEPAAAPVPPARVLLKALYRKRFGYDEPTLKETVEAVVERWVALVGLLCGVSM